MHGIASATVCVTRMYVKSKCTIPANHFEYFIMGAKYHYLPPVRHPPPLEPTPMAPRVSIPGEFAAGDSLPLSLSPPRIANITRVQTEATTTNQEWERTRNEKRERTNGGETDGNTGRAQRWKETNNRPVDSCRARVRTAKNTLASLHTRTCANTVYDGLCNRD